MNTSWWVSPPLAVGAGSVYRAQVELACMLREAVHAGLSVLPQVADYRLKFGLPAEAGLEHQLLSGDNCAPPRRIIQLEPASKV